MTGYSREDADRLKAKGERIVACFFCLHGDRRNPYYEASRTSMVGPMIACPDHRDGFGKIPVGDWLMP